MSHLSTITHVQIKSISAIERALLIANQKRNVQLTLKVAVGQTIRGWAGVTQTKRYTAVIQCHNLNADIGLAFIPDVNQRPNASPIIQDKVLQNGHFVLEGDLMMLGPLGPQLNLITNLYSAALIHPALAANLQDGQALEMELQEDNSIILHN